MATGGRNQPVFFILMRKLILTWFVTTPLSVRIKLIWSSVAVFGLYVASSYL